MSSSHHLTAFFGPTTVPGKALQMPVVFFEDFVGTYMAVDAALASESDPTGTFSETADRGVWLLSGDTIDATNRPTMPENADGGWMVMRTAANAGERTQVQVNAEMFTLARDRKAVFEWYGRLSNSLNRGFVGLAEANTDIYAGIVAGTAGAHVGLAFEAGSVVQTAVGNGTNSLTTTAGTYGSGGLLSAFTQLRWEWDGRDTFRFWADGTLIRTVPLRDITGQVLSANGATQAMSPVICLEQLDDASAAGITTDYIFVLNERRAD